VDLNARCPDCGVTLEPVEFMMQTERNPKVRTGEKKEGLLGTLGFDDNKPVDTGCCPECGLLRFYAQLE
jgi:rubredoxin